MDVWIDDSCMESEFANPITKESFLALVYEIVRVEEFSFSWFFPCWFLSQPYDCFRVPLPRCLGCVRVLSLGLWCVVCGLGAFNLNSVYECVIVFLFLLIGFPIVVLFFLIEIFFPPVRF